ncbi:DUF3313 domain-containing protein [Pseudomonas citronellolis]|uniref:DUF3313 domain-containing protein n=1 Tax=Pseudomonas citronellolis TaxID=53408 RepID=UPI0023E412A8|nr:DUF3313 domain-containing protein [Pseudomonas citronellolis]MDF3931845.1 DUF3313 domain-containing protein [Pseudomonas citronellolis]
MPLKQTLSALCLAAALAGCASKVPEPSQYSGFLGDYSQLQPASSPSGAPVLRWAAPGFDASHYSSVLVERPALTPRPTATERVDQATLDALPGYLQQAIAKRLGARYRLVGRAEPGTLILRSAITGVDVSNEGLHAYEVIPIALVVAATSSAIGTRDQATAVFIEAEAIDADSGQAVFKVVRKGAGKSLENASAKPTLGDLEPALDAWAEDAASWRQR